MQMIEFSKDQKEALDSILTWYKRHVSELPFFVFGGAAGTGKSTLIAYLRDYIPTRIAYCAFTGKATTVLRRKLSDIGISSDSVSTIHSLMYTPIVNDEKEIIGWKKNPSIEADLIVVDEASMIPKDIFDDLNSYHIPILYVGDHNQLPPISLNEFNLMEKAFIKLDTPHRFAENSPIIKLATRIKNGDTIKYGDHGTGVSKRQMKTVTPSERQRFFQSDELREGSAIILCGFNKTRVKLNSKIRSQFGFSGLLNIGERVICLKNNKSANIPLCNGSIGTVKAFNPSASRVSRTAVLMDGFSDCYRGNIYTDTFNEEKPVLHEGREKRVDCFDYGYCISVHKSQGSSFHRVCVFEEQCYIWDARRWLYTAVTRAESELLIIK